MHKIFLKISILTLSALALQACGGASVNVNTNRMASTAGNAANTVANAAANAANTVANSVTSATTTSPAEFAGEAAEAGMAEVEFAKLAGTKAKDPEVKKFAQMIVADHTKANAELKTLAQSKKWTLPAEPGSSYKETLADLKALSGAEFDKEYVDMMVEDHEDDVAAFQKQADNSSDAELKAFAAKVLPTLKKHLEQIRAIQAKMK